MAATEQQVLAGQAVYTKRMLAAYDLLVLGVSNRFIWRCPTQRLMELYNRRGIFSNEADDLDGLRRELRKRFEHVSIEVVGCAALFSARR